MSEKRLYSAKSAEDGGGQRGSRALAARFPGLGGRGEVCVAETSLAGRRAWRR